MPQRPPKEIMVKEAKQVNKWNKQVLYVEGAGGIVKELNLTDKSPKLPPGQINRSYKFEVWQYTPDPNKPKKWYGNLLNTPQNTRQAPPQATGRPNGTDKLIIRQVAAKIVGRLIEAKVLTYTVDGGLKNEIDRWSDWIEGNSYTPQPDSSIQDFDETPPDDGSEPDDIPF